MITCLICKKEFKILGRHLTNSHKITSSDYKIKFPGSKTLSDEESLRRTNSNYKLWTSRTEEEKSKLGQIRRKGWTSESLSSMIQSKLIYFDNLSEEEREVLKDRLHKLSINFHNLPEYEEIRISRGPNISKSHKVNFETNPTNYISRMLHANSKMHEWLRTCSEDELDIFLKRSFLSYPKRSFEYKGNTYKVRSSYEVIVLKLLVDLNLEFKYEVCLKRPDGRRYIADFIVENKLCLEPKSSHFVKIQGEYELGMKKLAAENSNFKFVLLTEEEIFKSNLLEYIKLLCHECGIQIKESVMI